MDRWHENQGSEMPIRYIQVDGLNCHLDLYIWSSGERLEHLIWDLSIYISIQSWG